jgi:hypothetical protein
MIRMVLAVPVIPTSGTYSEYARLSGRKTRFVWNIWMARIMGMIHLRPASLLIRLVGISGEDS